MVRGKSQALLLRNFQTCAQYMWVQSSPLPMPSLTLSTVHSTSGKTEV